jgi:hypothetical protein
VLLRRDEYLRVRADLDLALEGPLDGLSATGTVVVTDALYTRPADLLSRATSAAERSLRLFSIREGPFSTMRFDVHVKADESFRWRNNLFRGDASLDLRLRGTGLVPEPLGRIFFRDTLVRLPLTSLKVDRGEVTFPAGNPFVPEARVAAHTRMMGYDLHVEVKGAMPDFDVLVTTSPPMAAADAIVLLTTGATPEELERQGAMAAATRAGSYFGRRLVARYGGPSDPDEQGFLDRFEVRIGSDVSRRGDETVLGEFEVNRRWFLRAERDRFDDYNFGVVWRLRFR